MKNWKREKKHERRHKGIFTSEWKKKLLHGVLIPHKKMRGKKVFAFLSCRRMIILKIIRHETWIVWNLNTKMMMMVNWNSIKTFAFNQKVNLQISRRKSFASCLQTSFLFLGSNNKKMSGTFAVYSKIK